MSMHHQMYELKGWHQLALLLGSPTMTCMWYLTQLWLTMVTWQCVHWVSI